MKKSIAILTAFSLCFTMASCGNSVSNGTKEETSQIASTIEETTEEPAADEAATEASTVAPEEATTQAVPETNAGNLPAYATEKMDVTNDVYIHTNASYLYNEMLKYGFEGDEEYE